MANMSSEIQEFYQNSTIFLTGATGFVGKLVLEKLLRSCSNLCKIYILIREKRNKTSLERFEEIFNEPVWDMLKKQLPDYRKKLEIIEGNCIEPNLGLKSADLTKLQLEVDVVMHCAATVRFNEDIKLATLINIRAVSDLVKLCRKMKKLKALVHVSTAYSNCNRDLIEEVFYKPPIPPQALLTLIETFDEVTLNQTVDKLLGPFPNTYTFTKNLGENLLAKEGAGLPIAIVRPSIIAGTFNEPIQGYIDKPFGFSGSVQGIVYGVLRCLLGKRHVKTDLIPGDFVANNIIAAGWYIGSNFKQNSASSNVQIYHCTSSESKLFTVRDYVERIVNLGRTKLASKFAIWYPFAFVVESELVFQVVWFLLHTIPAYFVYFSSIFFGNKQKRYGLVRLYRKTKKLTHILGYFMLKQWEFKNDNCRQLYKQMSESDKVLFNFNMTNMDWNVFLERQIKGIKLHLANEKPPTNNGGGGGDNGGGGGGGQAQMKKLRFLHFLFLFCTSLGLGGVLYKMLSYFILR